MIKKCLEIMIGEKVEIQIIDKDDNNNSVIDKEYSLFTDDDYELYSSDNYILHDAFTSEDDKYILIMEAVE